jgi:hypothetical protein
MHAWQREHFRQDFLVLVRWLGNPNRVTCEPTEHLTPGLANRFRAVEYPRVGDEAQERQQARPRQPNGRRPVELLVQPGARPPVLSKRLNVRVN